jgi:hypothetical protein
MGGGFVPGRKSKQWRRIRSCFLSCSTFLAIANLTSRPARGQTASTGALSGVVLAPSGVALPGATILLVNQETSEEESTASDEQGRFGFQFLSPGKYELRASKPSFEPLRGVAIDITVTEVLRIETHLQLAKLQQSVRVSSDVLMIQADNSALGREVSGSTLTNLPLVTRNYTQVAILSPGVVAGVFNAGELGTGGMPLSQISGSTDGIYVHGGRSYDNNYQLDGVSVNDVQGSGSSSGGLPIPSPDTIYEFKVQTGLYDASYGRYGGANVSVITKTGGNAFHGAFFEYFRNDALNANDFFLNSASQPRPALKQNQFGATLGGPILKDKLFFFCILPGNTPGERAGCWTG